MRHAALPASAFAVRSARTLGRISRAIASPLARAGTHDRPDDAHTPPIHRIIDKRVTVTHAAANQKYSQNERAHAADSEPSGKPHECTVRRPALGPGDAPLAIAPCGRRAAVWAGCTRPAARDISHGGHTHTPRKSKSDKSRKQRITLPALKKGHGTHIRTNPQHRRRANPRAGLSPCPPLTDFPREYTSARGPRKAHARALRRATTNERAHHIPRQERVPDVGSSL